LPIAIAAGMFRMFTAKYNWYVLLGHVGHQQHHRLAALGAA